MPHFRGTQARAELLVGSNPAHSVYFWPYLVFKKVSTTKKDRAVNFTGRRRPKNGTFCNWPYSLSDNLAWLDLIEKLKNCLQFRLRRIWWAKLEMFPSNIASWFRRFKFKYFKNHVAGKILSKDMQKKIVCRLTDPKS